MVFYIYNFNKNNILFIKKKSFKKVGVQSIFMHIKDSGNWTCVFEKWHTNGQNHGSGLIATQSIWIEVIPRYESMHKSKYVSTFGIIAITIITIVLLALILTIAECFGRKGSFINHVDS